MGFLRLPLQMKGCCPSVVTGLAKSRTDHAAARDAIMHDGRRQIGAPSAVSQQRRRGAPRWRLSAKKTDPRAGAPRAWAPESAPPTTASVWNIALWNVACRAQPTNLV